MKPGSLSIVAHRVPADHLAGLVRRLESRAGCTVQRLCSRTLIVARINRHPVLIALRRPNGAYTVQSLPGLFGSSS